MGVLDIGNSRDYRKLDGSTQELEATVKAGANLALGDVQKVEDKAMSVGNGAHLAAGVDIGSGGDASKNVGGPYKFVLTLRSARSVADSLRLAGRRSLLCRRVLKASTTLLKVLLPCFCWGYTDTFGLDLGKGVVTIGQGQKDQKPAEDCEDILAVKSVHGNPSISTSVVRRSSSRILLESA